MELNRQSAYIMIAILCFAAILRIGFAASLPTSFIEPWESDAGVYRNIAINIINAGTFGREYGKSDAEDPPLYPFFLALMYKIFGTGNTAFLAVRIVQSLIGVFTCFLVYIIGKKVSGVATGMIAAFLVAAHPGIVAYAGMHLTETLYMLLLALFVLWFIRSYTEDTARSIFLCGILWGLTVLCREVLMLLPPFMIIGFLIAGKGVKSAARFTALFLAGALIILGPWIARNYISLRRFIPVTEGGGEVLYASQYVGPDERWSPDGGRLNRIIMDVKTEVGSSYVRKTAKNLYGMIRHRPLLYLDKLFRKFKELWLHPSGLYQIPDKTMKKVYLLTHYILLLFFAAQVAYSFTSKVHLPLILLLFYTTVFHVFIFFPLARYMVPFLPYVFIFSAQGFIKAGSLLVLKTKKDIERKA